VKDPSFVQLMVAIRVLTNCPIKRNTYFHINPQLYTLNALAVANNLVRGRFLLISTFAKQIIKLNIFFNQKK
jgi:hypothetical protein